MMVQMNKKNSIKIAVTGKGEVGKSTIAAALALFTAQKGKKVLVLDAIQAGGVGCACPENILLRALVQHLILHNDEVLFMDMEPGQRSLESYKRISRMAAEIGIKNISVVANNINS